MFLSKLQPNLRNPLARRDLASPYEMHRTLLAGGFGAAAKDDLGRVLFRIDADRPGTPVVLVQSDTRPDWDALPEKYLAAEAESKPFELVVSKGQKLRFRLRANPTKRLPVPLEAWRGKPSRERPKGLRVGLRTEAEQVRWLLGKGEAGGFAVAGAWLHRRNSNTGEAGAVPNFRVDVIPEGRARNDKVGHRDGAFLAVRFEGVLEVTDAVRFADTVRHGVGSAKGFGFGLLSVTRA